MGFTLVLAGCSLAGRLVAEPVRVSERFGFRPDDATECLQAAFDSGLPEIEIDRQAQPWIVSKTLLVKSDMRIVFGHGVVLEARRGAFHGVGESLVKLARVRNVTLEGDGSAVLRMHVEDYVKPPYEKSEWRHALDINSSEDITVRGLRMENSGGDGIYLGSWGDPNRRVRIRGCVCDGNNRQGMSVISVSDLLVEDSVFSNTRGTPPQAGIDFEPNSPTELLENIVIRNCRTENNASCGVEFFLEQCNRDTPEITVTFEKCVFSGDRYGLSLVPASRRSSLEIPFGHVYMNDCRIENTKKTAINVARKPDRTVALIMKGCEIVNCCKDDVTQPEVVLRSHRGYNKPTDAVLFGDLTIRRTAERPWLDMEVPETPTETIKYITGKITLIGPGEAKRSELLDKFWMEKSFPAKIHEAMLPTVRPAFADTAAADLAPGEMAELEPMNLRQTCKYLVRADKPGKVRLVGFLGVLNKKGGRHPVDARVADAVSGKSVATVRLAFDSETEIAFDAPCAGFYLLQLNAGGSHAFRLVRGDTPVGILHDGQLPAFLGSAGRVTFFVPAHGRFSVQAKGGDHPKGSVGERINLAVCAPDGRRIWSEASIMELTRCQPKKAVPKGGFWTIERSSPTEGTFDDNGMGLTGVQGVFFLSDRKRWTVKDLPAPDVNVTVDPAKAVGPVKPVNGIGQPPQCGMDFPLMHYLKEAGIPYSRLHDVGGMFGGNLFVDIPNIFRNFDADENDPKNYDFVFTDRLMLALEENGVEPFYRLGVTIENWAKIRSYRIDPPKDYAKWARIAEHVIRHYTEGWADGYRMKVGYWEIWNEPENSDVQAENPMWNGDWKSFCDFYGVVAPYLKGKFPSLKIGGYGSCGFYAAAQVQIDPAAKVNSGSKYKIEVARIFLSRARQENWPLDFFSYHSYSEPRTALIQVDFARKLLDEYGFTKTETSFNEWLPTPSLKMLGTARQAAMVAAELIGLQNGPCDTAMIYDGKCGCGPYSPLFNPMNQRPHRAYSVYLAFNELRKLGTAVACSNTGKAYACAASRDGTTALLVANYESEDDVPFSVTGFTPTEAWVIDETHDYEKVPVPTALPPNTVVLLR